MHVPTRFAISWLVGHSLPEHRDRRLVAGPKKCRSTMLSAAT